MKKDVDLLETLHRLVGCEYMSDLKSDLLRRRLLRVVDEMDPSRFSLDQWENAISYLFQTEASIRSLEDLRTFLEQYKHQG